MELMASKYLPVDHGDRQKYCLPLPPCLWAWGQWRALGPQSRAGEGKCPQPSGGKK